MKTWLVTHKRRLLALGIVAVMGVAFYLGWRTGTNATDRKAYAALWEAIVELPNPEQCALCGEKGRYYAPCLIDLSTGQVGKCGYMPMIRLRRVSSTRGRWSFQVRSASNVVLG